MQVQRLKEHALGLVVLGAMLASLAACMKASGGRANPTPSAQPDPAPPPTYPNPEPSPSPLPPAFGLHVDPTVGSIQSNLMDIYCVSCHAGASPPRGLDLTDLDKFLPPNNPHSDPNGYHGTLIAPGNPSRSMLLMVMKSTRSDQMPPPTSGFPPVTDDQLQSVEEWITSLSTGSGDGGDDEPGDGSDDEPGDGAGGDDEPGTDDGGDDEPGDD